MAPRKPRTSTRSSGAAASKGSGGAAASPDPSERPARPEQVEVRAGGFVTTADAPAPTPEPIIPCSVCGAHLVDDHCPNGHGQNKSGGWRIADEDG